MAVQRIELLGVPVDVFSKSELEERIIELLEDDKRQKQIVFLSVWDLLRARRKTEYRECVKNADLIIPISKSIVSGAKFLKKGDIIRHNSFSTVISIISIVENRLKSFYILGGRKKALLEAEKNVRGTFRNLRIVGRYVGYYKKDAEEAILQAIYKAAPSLVLLSDGIKEKDLWSYTRKDKLNNGIFLYYHDAVGIFSKRIRRVSNATFEKGMEIWQEIINNPLKVFLLFSYIYYIILLVWNKLFGKGK